MVEVLCMNGTSYYLYLTLWSSHCNTTKKVIGVPNSSYMFQSVRMMTKILSWKWLPMVHFAVLLSPMCRFYDLNGPKNCAENLSAQQENLGDVNSETKISKENVFNSLRGRTGAVLYLFIKLLNTPVPLKINHTYPRSRSDSFFDCSSNIKLDQ